MSKNRFANSYVYKEVNLLGIHVSRVGHDNLAGSLAALDDSAEGNGDRVQADLHAETGALDDKQRL